MRTDTRAIPVIDGEAWDVTDAWTTTRYRRPTRREMLARSQFARHLRAASRAAFWPAVGAAAYMAGALIADIAGTVL